MSGDWARTHSVWTRTLSPAWIEKNGTDEVRLAMFPSFEDAEYLVKTIGIVWHYSELWITDYRGNVVMRKANGD